MRMYAYAIRRYASRTTHGAPLSRTYQGLSEVNERHFLFFPRPFFSSHHSTPSMASSLPPNGLSPANAIRAHGKAHDILQNDASRGNVAVHTFDPDAPPAEKAAAAGKAKAQLTSAIPAKTSDGGRGQRSLYVFSASC